MDLQYRTSLTFTALKNWFVAQCYDSAIVGGLWLVALLILKVPFAPLWALLGGALQFIPNFGPVIALIGPSLALLFADPTWERFIALLVAYAVIAAVDGLVLQPYLMKRHNRVPFWASLVVPIIMGFIIPFWGVLLAPPLLAVYYAHRRKRGEAPVPQRPPVVRAGEGILLPPERPTRR